MRLSICTFIFFKPWLSFALFTHHVPYPIMLATHFERLLIHFALFLSVLSLQSWTKVLGQIYICGVFSHVPNEQPGANSFTYVQPLPPSTMLDTCTRYFSRGSTLYVGGGEGGKQCTLKRKTVLF